MIGRNPETKALATDLNLAYFNSDDKFFMKADKLENKAPWVLDVVELPENDYDRRAPSSARNVPPSLGVHETPRLEYTRNSTPN